MRRNRRKTGRRRVWVTNLTKRNTCGPWFSAPFAKRTLRILLLSLAGTYSARSALKSASLPGLGNAHSVANRLARMITWGFIFESCTPMKVFLVTKRLIRARMTRELPCVTRYYILACTKILCSFLLALVRVPRLCSSKNFKEFFGLRSPGRRYWLAPSAASSISGRFAGINWKHILGYCGFIWRAM